MLFVSTLYRAVYALDRYFSFSPFSSTEKIFSFFLSLFPSLCLSLFFLSFLFKKREREREDRGGEKSNAIL